MYVGMCVASSARARMFSSWFIRYILYTCMRLTVNSSYIDLCAFVCERTRVLVNACIPVRLRVYVCVTACVYVCACVRTSGRIMCVCMCVCVCVYVVCMSACVRVCVHECMYMCMCV